VVPLMRGGRGGGGARTLANGKLPNVGLPEEEFSVLKTKLWRFMETEIYPNEKLFEEQSREIELQGNEWYEPAILKELKGKAKEANLWK
jgi:hypothetical protein